MTENGRERIERILVQEWSELLPEATVEPSSNIFALGAHSLMIGRIASRCRARHGIDLEFAAFFELPVIRDLARSAAERAAAS
ncbi:acyl carrier protein [Nocardioides sp.]|uniref:acyl carrier protein n=1 Tax=Nocardioides sp. TaxID=35761 RepID=UPI002ED8EB2A